MPLQRADEVIAAMKNKRIPTREVVEDWKALLPEGSRWWPGCPGDPACKKCEGTGYITFRPVEISSPLYGKIFLCECTQHMQRPVTFTQGDLP